MNNICDKIKAMKEKKDELKMNSELYNGIYIPLRFRNVVLKHLILNYSNNINSFSPPLMLAIQGEKGEGKSFMIEKLCEYYSIECIHISGAELCGSFEGDSIKKLMSEYDAACIKAEDDRKLSCIVVDDFHKSLAATKQDNVFRTTNSETLVGRIMNLADNPYVCNNRIPIILTGNNLTSIYSPLTRNGRMDIFDWIPTLLEKETIVYNIFRKYYPDIEFNVIKQLVNKYNDKYIAFFKSVAQDVFWGNCDSLSEAFHNIKGNIDLDNITKLVSDNISLNADISLNNILEVAEIRSKQIPKDYD